MFCLGTVHLRNGPCLASSMELWMHAGSWESTRKAFEWHEAKSSASLASQLHRCTAKAWTISFRTLPL